ncbi:hypothetical protein BXZ70DRAFT_1011506 [Cristinia sonorae]|uniref:Extracellular serine-rich protein n=1 Tax=Cristinia sonorae TaxID=1940300 RepID=A0A8K0UG03_9AGAR|nr:hypothetical protein BXZ70DRAFT_1011506 [Cristinia sonorae]
MRTVAALVAALSASVASAKNIIVTVGGNTTDNATTVFDPAQVFAQPNDIVIFNFTQGNHTATQSSFANPCIFLDFTTTQHGFDSGFRNAGNGSNVTIQSVPITPDLVNKTLWFFDYNTCAQGGVGGININDSSTETLEGFVRNAVRLNGTDADDNNSSTNSNTSTTGAPRPSGTNTGNTDTGDASRQHVTWGFAAVVPLVIAAFAL